MKIDKKHSLFWNAPNFEFYITKLKGKDAFGISIKRGEKVESAIFTGGEFSSLICECVKYCLDLPIVARRIPCPVDCSMVPHGCLQAMRIKQDKRGRRFMVMDKRWFEYHGRPKIVRAVEKDTPHGKALFFEAVGSRALKRRKSL